MASPMMEGRVDPHKKAHFNLHIGDRIAKGDSEAGGGYSSVKYNHKPTQSTSSRTTTLTAASGNSYKLKLEDRDEGVKKDVFVFTGQRTTPQPSYVLLLDPASQRATLEPLSSTYTFNLAAKNADSSVSSSFPKIYPKKSKRDSEPTSGDNGDLFDDDGGDAEDAEPDSHNPYDFRHFLNLTETKDKRGDESDYKESSPDYRTGTGSALNTPLVTAARNPAASLTSKPKSSAQPAIQKVKKRKSPGVDPFMPKKPVVKKQGAVQAPPAVRLERRATEPKAAPAPSASTTTVSQPRKTAAKAAAPPSSKIKSSEIVHSSDDESDVDADGEPDSQPVSSPPHRSPSPPHSYSQHQDSEPESDEDDEGPSGGIGLEIEVPDAGPSPSKPRAMASLGMGQNISRGYLESPSNGPISLASAANSVEGSPNPRSFGSTRNTQDESIIDFGDLGGHRGDDSEEEEEEEEWDRDDKDVDIISIGPPAQTATQIQTQHQSKPSGESIQVEEDEDDPLYKEMMEGLAGGDSSEESEEE